MLISGWEYLREKNNEWVKSTLKAHCVEVLKEVDKRPMDDDEKDEHDEMQSKKRQKDGSQRTTDRSRDKIACLSAVQALPDHKDRFRKLQIHLEICERCSEVVSSPKFQEMIALEQDLVTKGLNPKSEKELLAFLQDPAVKANLKLRLLMLCEVSWHVLFHAVSNFAREFDGVFCH
ncbi:unnamed protein product [Cladocopium goreaui]|uniref:Uncharacterized protein n=1 Tax=Cladocopium goreaui TaxID=2562237 RepID=A0A9P1FGX8_9DINO|nr:unnamed protein product [Cladocopium goreaui]